MATPQIIIPQVPKGHFEWNNQNNCLEFISSDPTADTRDKKKRSQTGKYGMFPWSGKRKDGMSTIKSQHAYSAGLGSSRAGGGVRTIGPQRVSPKLGGLRYNTNSNVTLKDVKGVAMECLINDYDNANTDISVTFRHLVETAEFDDFLVSLLHYFQCFFDQLEHEQKPHKTSFLEPSKAELQALSETKQKLEVTRKRLGQSYCVVILGLGLEKQHHMGCGKKRVSSTHRDKKMFEDLYLFCTYVIWVTFRRKEWEKVKVEVGNMLRSKAFNPALQQKHYQQSESDDNRSIHVSRKKEALQKPVAERVQDLLSAKLPVMEKLTPAQHRRKTGKRVAIMTAIHQRSTALVSLLPSPKEESEYLFNSHSQKDRAAKANRKSTSNNIFSFTAHDLMSLKIGIIGEPTELFNMDNLVPKSMENEDEDSSSEANLHESSSPITSDRGANRQANVISRATTIDES